MPIWTKTISLKLKDLYSYAVHTCKDGFLVTGIHT